MIYVEVKTEKDKEYFYIGTYENEEYRIIKIGTTNNLDRREKEHQRSTEKLKNYAGKNYHMLWHIKLSHANTLRAEDRMREKMREHPNLQYIANDRFAVLGKVPDIQLKVRKVHNIELGRLLES